MTCTDECGDKHCPKYNASCLKILESHKFYLALENSKCRNYITEKVWLNAFQRTLVPIVYGPPKEDYELVLPPNSFIFIEDFASLSNLAEYIMFLNNSDNIYNQYHAWRISGNSVSTPGHLRPRNMCRVIERLLHDEISEKTGSFQLFPQPDWDLWWLGSCQSTEDFPIKME